MLSTRAVTSAPMPQPNAKTVKIGSIMGATTCTFHVRKRTSRFLRQTASASVRSTRMKANVCALFVPGEGFSS